MAIHLTRKTPSSWTLKWPHTSPLVSSYSAASDTFRVQRECGDDAYIVKDATAHCRYGTFMKMVALTTHPPLPTPHYRFLSRNNVRSSHVSSTTSAWSSPSIARMLFQSLYFSMISHIRMESTEVMATIPCWSCGKPKPEKGCLLCPLCNAVQAFDPAITYFQIFDQEHKFELDLKDLEANYKSLMKKLHPDLSHGKSTEEKENYARLSALVTTAYTVLLKPVSRATYMLKLRGIHVEEEGTVTDSELIMEVMEMKETLQSLPDRKTLEQLQNRAMTRMDEWSKAFNAALKEGDTAAAVGALQRMSYFGRVCDDINRELL